VKEYRYTTHAEGEHPEAPGWDLGDGLPTWERELVPSDLEEVDELVGTGVGGSE